MCSLNKINFLYAFFEMKFLKNLFVVVVVVAVTFFCVDVFSCQVMMKKFLIWDKPELLMLWLKKVTFSGILNSWSQSYRINLVLKKLNFVKLLTNITLMCNAKIINWHNIQVNNLCTFWLVRTKFCFIGLASVRTMCELQTLFKVISHGSQKKEMKKAFWLWKKVASWKKVFFSTLALVKN